jgi:hypothetical protein
MRELLEKLWLLTVDLSEGLISICEYNYLQQEEIHKFFAEDGFINQ